ncbi:MAG TPA: flagellar filament capping protein FliD [Planctomycetota bacterium]|nr:flagellar filament capping protein FliD [Planctomycetota bacterium]
MAGISGVGGLASGIDSNQIIDAMVEADRATTRLLENRKGVFAAQLDAVRGFNTRLLSTQLDLAALKRPSTFQTRTATSSAPTVATATATSAAQAGTYQLTVERRAQAHQLTTGGIATTTQSLGTGDVVIQVGSGAALTVSLTAANSSLDGLAAAINAAGGDVSAQIINDGSAEPYRLVLTARATGADNTIAFDADALTGGSSDEFQRVVSTVDVATTSALTSSGFFSGANGPKEYQIEVESGGTAGVAGATATFKWSSDGGATWTSGVAADAGSLVLSNGVSVAFSAGDVTTGDAFVVRPLQELAAAQDAKVRYGDGASYVSVESSSNAITGLIAGVTFNAVAAGSTTVTIGADSSGARAAIDKAVESYNAAITYLRDNSAYDPKTGKAGPLLSEASLRRSLDTATRAFFDVIPNLPTNLNSTTALGISVDRFSGKLTVDGAKLDAKIAADPEGVMRVFNNTGTSTNTAIQYAALSDKTDVSQPFAVNILLPATQAVAGATSDLAASTVIGSGNNTLAITLNGRAVTATIASGTYSRAQLATQVESAINAVATRADKVAVGLAGDRLEVRSALYGSSQTIEVTGGTANAALFLDTTTEAVGVNVAGTIDGVAATGTGQVLSGVVGQRSEGLRLLVTSTTATSGTVTARKGVGQLFGDKIVAMTAATFGSVVQTEDGLEAVIDGLADRITKMDIRLEQRRQRYQALYLQMEKLIQGFQSQGNAISGQVAGFQNMAAARARG